ncbi:hypothetical protein [Nocardioides sp. AE5]|uniref:hypothetical protein n=1 Tax=Nocardioides sp. AE5 TaxID=2962573 RepID=UPI002881CFB9|nr:hypothetical protein [Nocardioides sp. AE5]MDT0202536.1 hypothetical protein [Nocardioides sp. AE5]
MSETPTPPAVFPGFERFGSDFIRLVLPRERVFASIDRILGETFHLGPIGAGPGRKLARITASGTFGKTYGDELPGDLPGFRFILPVAVTFDLDMQVDHARFLADVQLPLELTMELEDPLIINWVIHPPTEDEVVLSVSADSRRSALLQKVAGIDGELRRFILRFVARELEKPHVRKAMRIDLPSLIDNAWPALAAQFLPNSPEDRQAPAREGMGTDTQPD